MESPTATRESEEDLLAEDILAQLNFDELNITSADDEILDETEAAGHIQANLDDELVQEALRQGVDMRQYSRQIESELRKVELKSIEDYIRESRHIASLHYQIHNCDKILARMEDMLGKFQTDLGSISSEIQSLQDQSHSMSIKLKNRQAVRGELSQFVSDVTITEHLVQHMTDTPVSEREFIENLHELDHKIKFLNLQNFNDCRAAFDVRDVVDKLKIKAISKIREYLLHKIYQFRKPMTNYHMTQNQLLNYKYFNEFLMAHSRETAQQVRSEYMDTMGKIYYSYFKDYYSKLMKLQFEETAEKDDLMGAEDTMKRGFFSTKTVLKNRSTIFTLGNRDTVLTTELEDPIIVVPHAQRAERKYSFESLFRSIHFALMDNGCREYLFVVEFFNLTPSAAQDFFDSIFGRTLAYLLKNIESYTDSCYDSIGIFLCIHVSLRYQAITKRREIPCLDDYHRDLASILWPRFRHILELNVTSVKNTDPSKLGSIDTRPHYVTRRYAEFSAALVGINQSHPDDQVDHALSSLQGEVENFVLRMAAEFPQRKEQLIFLINNYDMLLAVLAERTSEESKESQSFKSLLHSRTQEFVEEVLSPYFGGLIGFVKDAEPLLERGERDKIRMDERRIQQLVRGFASDWKKSIETLNHDIMQSFTNFKNGTAILQGALAQLIQYYHRFQKVLSQQPFKALQIRGELINIHHLMVEVKKQKTSF
ncbi:vacuolar protein sorting-associated protein 52 homolog [Halichondria panicea]|uniref:vacuolar protein sorting-associated protein 52 homolog n=1 Tax=Halichondria panicea TaxID=6063 RepID=UPI00312B4BDC